jgi:glycosyltransferase involved in cell wall biosynthesis
VASAVFAVYVLGRGFGKIMEIGDLSAVRTKSECDVTVVIPTYNRKELCIRAIKSVLAQTLVPKQIVVVDDGSKDGTAEALKELYGDLVLVIKQANGGVSAARNTGVKYAACKYIAFLDSDDQWLEKKIALQYEWLKNNSGQDAVVCDYNWVSSEGVLLKREFRACHFNATGENLNHVLEHPYLLPSTLMISRELFLATKGFDSNLKTAEDIDLILKLALIGKIGLVPEPLVDYVAQGPDRLSESAGSTKDHVFVVQRFVRENRTKLTSKQAKSALFAAYIGNSRSASMDGRPYEATAYLLKSVKYVSSKDAFSNLLEGTAGVMNRLIRMPFRALRDLAKQAN